MTWLSRRTLRYQEKYLNDELICGSSILNERDRIEIGASTFIFVPLCGDNFDWNE